MDMETAVTGAVRRRAEREGDEGRKEITTGHSSFPFLPSHSSNKDSRAQEAASSQAWEGYSMVALCLRGCFGNREQQRDREREGVSEYIPATGSWAGSGCEEVTKSGRK